MAIIKEFYNVAASTGEPQKGEYRSRHRNGNWVWLESVVTPVLDEQGKVSQLVIVSRDISERKGYEAKLQRLAYHDPLTDLPNRRLFGELVEQAFEDAKLTKRKVGIMYMDLDGFKEINDTHGHDIGDELLVQFTRRVRENLREIDVFARMGGDEFTILLPRMEKLYVNVVAKRILQAIQEPFSINGHSIKITSSIGIALYPDHGVNVEGLIKNADSAMYQAKVNGKNDFQFAE